MTMIPGAELVYSSLPHFTCRCGKRGWSAREYADQVIVKAKIARELYGNRNRAEVRAYRCDVGAGVWHVTSQPGSSGQPARPRYAPDDDNAAREFLSAAIFFGDERPWAELHSVRYCAQTLRVLRLMHQSLQVKLADRRKALAQADTAQQEGRMGGARLRELADEHGRWRAQAVAMNDLLIARIGATRDALKQVNIIRAQGGKRHESQHHRAVVRRLALAIRRHQRAIGEEHASPDDRRLWALLDHIEVPNGREATGTPIAALLADRAWTEEPGDDEPLRYVPPTDEDEVTTGR